MSNRLSNLTDDISEIKDNLEDLNKGLEHLEDVFREGKCNCDCQCSELIGAVKDLIWEVQTLLRKKGDQP